MMRHIDAPSPPHNPLGEPVARPRAKGASGPQDRQAAKHTGPEGRLLDVLSTVDTGRCSTLPKGFFGPDRYGPFRVDNTRLGALQARALADGAPRSAHGPVWDVSGKGKWACSDPLDISLLSAETEATAVGPSIRLLVRCRKCEDCRKARAALWKLRAISEIEKSCRTWFVTLTWRPADRLKIDYAAGLRLAQAGIDEPSEQEMFAARLAAASPHVTRYLKRVRKGLAGEGEKPVQFRYLLIWETHTDGFPHAHLLLHEQTLGDLPQKRVVTHWWAGFSRANLVERGDEEERHKRAAYITKYIAKAMPVRIRASHSYGVN